MPTKQFIGSSALALFIVALAILVILLVLVFSPTLQKYVPIDAQVLLVLSAVLALVAAVLGFYAFETPHGKTGAAGGLILFVVLVMVLLYITIASVQTSGALPSQPVANAGIAVSHPDD